MADDLTSVAWRNQQPQGLLPIPATRTYKASDADKLRYDVTGYGLNEVRKLLVSIAGEETAQQIQLNNPPAFVNVDGVRGRSITAARRRITVSFGARLKMQALNLLKVALARAINASTKAKTGTLANMSNWEYRYVRNGRAQALPLGGASGIPMGPSDFIVLVPKGVTRNGHPYATAVNKRVASAGKLQFRRSARAKVTRKNQNIGFLALTARAAQTAKEFDGFNVTAAFSTRHALPGEVMRRGQTGYIKIRPKTGRGSRRG